MFESHRSCQNCGEQTPHTFYGCTTWEEDAYCETTSCEDCGGYSRIEGYGDRMMEAHDGECPHEGVYCSEHDLTGYHGYCEEHDYVSEGATGKHYSGYAHSVNCEHDRDEQHDD